MSPDTDEIVRVYTGPLVQVEAYQQVLSESGLESKVVGTELTASFGSALSESIELWVHKADVERAVAAVKRHEEEMLGNRAEPGVRFSHPVSDHKPGAAPLRKEPHVKQDPSGE